MNPNDEGLIRHLYYKGLREIDFGSYEGYVAWTDMQLCFREREAEPLDNDTAKVIRFFIWAYGKAFNVFRYVSPLMLYGDYFDTAKYGVNIRMGYIPNKKDKEVIMNMLHFLVEISNADELYDCLLSKIEVDGFTGEQIKEKSPTMMEDLKSIQTELKEFIRLVEEEGRYIYINDWH